MTFKSLIQTAVVVVASLVSTMSRAVLPDGGWYWNPQESGRGFNIEIQNNVLFMAGFVYDATGRPLWIISGGPMSSDRNYVGDALVTDGGQCVGCAYSAPSATKFGTVSISFTGPSTAQITVNGTTIDVQRQQFGLDFSSVATPLLGEWMVVEGDKTLPLYSGERIQFGMTLTSTSTGTPFAAGSRSGSPDDTAVGSYDSATRTWSILLDSSTSYYRFYVFQFAAFDRLEGTRYLFQKGTTPGTGVNFIGQRIKSAAAAAGVNAPGTEKELSVGLRSKIDGRDDAQARSVGDTALTGELLGTLRALESALQLTRTARDR